MQQLYHFDIEGSMNFVFKWHNFLTHILNLVISKNSKNTSTKPNPAWPLASPGKFQKFWAPLCFTTLPLEAFLCTFYIIVESCCKQSKHGFGWCQAFHIFWTYFTQSLDDGKILCCFYIIGFLLCLFWLKIFL